MGWRDHVEKPKEYTIEDQIRDLEASIEVKRRAISYWQTQMNQPWNRNLKGTVRSYENKIRQIELDIRSIESRITKLQTEPAASTEVEQGAGMEGEEVSSFVEERGEPQTTQEMILETEIEDTLINAMEDNTVETDFAQELHDGGREVATEVFNEVKSVEDTGLPSTGEREAPEYKYEYVKKFVDVICKGVDDSYATERGFSSLAEYKLYVIQLIEKNPTVLNAIANWIIRNKSVSSTLRLIAKVAQL